MLIKNVLSAIFIFLMFSPFFAEAGLFSNSGKVEDGYYYAPNKRFKVMCPMPSSRGMSKNFTWYPPKTSEDDGTVYFSFDGYHQIHGGWMAGRMKKLPKQYPFAEWTQIGAEIGAYNITKLDNPQLAFSKTLTINGRTAYRYCYTGMLNGEPTGFLVTFIDDGDYYIGLDLTFKNSNAQTYNYYLSKYDEFCNSFVKFAQGHRY